MREFYLKAFLGLVRNRKTVKTVEGMTFELDLSEMIDACIFLERFEPDIVALIDRLVRPGWIVFDIGANIGAHALRLAKATSPGGRVYAFEPTEFAFRKLQINAALNDFSHLHAYQLALSDRNLQCQRINFRSSWRSDGSRSDAESIVDFQRLDDWCTQQNVDHVDLIKIDVDGNEFAVMSGGERVISACRPTFLIEVGAWHFTDPGRNPLELLHGLGYRFWDSKTLVEYPDLAAIRRLLPERDEELGFSMNLLAATRFPEPRQSRDS